MERKINKHEDAVAIYFKVGFIDEDMYKVKVKKAGQFDFEKVNLNIVEQEQLNTLVFKFFSADFETREKMLKYEI